MAYQIDLSGKWALVTGGGSGIGLAIAEGLAEAGASVILVNRSESAQTQAKRLSDTGLRAYAIMADLSLGEAEVERVCQSARTLSGGELDILVNAAGTTHICMPEDHPIEEFDRVLNLNLRALFLMCQHCARGMLKRRTGRIINIASMISFFGGRDIPGYAASKGAVAQLTKTLSNAWCGRGVTVNAIAPGFIETKLIDARMSREPETYERVRARIPMARWGVPDDLKGIGVFLASDAAAYISGAVIPVDGGYLVN